MLFSSLLFIFLYLVFVLLIYYLLPRKFRNVFLFVVNLIFYGWGEPVFVLIMLFSIFINYLYGRLIHQYRDNRRRRKIILILGIAANLALLGFFKYAGFVVELLKNIPIFSAMQAPLIPLPIGISFYTFQTMSYIIDVYRNDTKVQKSFVNFGTYVALFPQLIAGPIVRYKDVEEQLEHRLETPEQFTQGVRLFLVGLAKKVLIANQMGLLWDTVRPALAENGLFVSWAGIIAFSLQIYFDFGGYSDMARGLGNMIGFEFIKNFDYPYISRSITEFWRRWHISLGTWFREYVYIPLGGNRKGKLRLLMNLLIVWGLTGLWHGASWNFVLWGLYFGVLLMIEKLFLLKVLEKIPRFFSHTYALFFIIMGWVIFYFERTPEMLRYFESLFTAPNGLWGNSQSLTIVLSYLPLLLAGIFASLPVTKKIYYRLKEKKYFWVLESLSCAAVLLVCTAALVSQSYNPFLYFRF